MCLDLQRTESDVFAKVKKREGDPTAVYNCGQTIIIRAPQSDYHRRNASTKLLPSEH